MNKNFNILNKIIPYIYVVLSAYVISAIISLYLPKSSIEFQDTKTINIEYKKYGGFYSISGNEPVYTSNSKKDNIETLERYELKAVYSTLDNKGWIIVEQKGSNNSVILQQFDELNGYTLIKLYKDYVIFTKNSKEYKLEISIKKDINYEVENNTIDEKITVEDGNIKVQRNYLNTYVKDINKVWNNIAISELKKENQVEGFKIDNVNKDSVFAKLGLQKGDVIKAINGKEIKSYADAFKVYNEINNIDFLRIDILRNNEIVELSYEIN